MVSGLPPISVNYSSAPQRLVADRSSISENKLGASERVEKKPVGELSEEEKSHIAQLKKTDQEVRQHEQAHKNAGGQYAGSASYGYTVGPDGKRYATSGEVSIDIAPVEGDPEATIDKMNAVVSAALAPAKPSAQDRKVAAQAISFRAEAQAELAQQSRSELNGEYDKGNNATQISVLQAYKDGANVDVTEKSSGNILDLFS